MKKLTPFSKKQLKAMLWWNMKDSCNFDAIIADGAVRSGKTFSMSLGFIFWSMKSFDKSSFGICSKTIKSARRNVVKPLFDFLSDLQVFKVRDYLSKGYFEISTDSKTNRYYIFSGRDQSSASLIQGITLSGLLLDEIALMPRSFVEQAIARCSVTNSKLWFNCNPDNPYHWFKEEWIDKTAQKNCLYLHFELKDNPSLSPQIIKRYHTLYSGAFYQRFILGKWCGAEGLVYPHFNTDIHCVKNLPSDFTRFVISVDYGTVNPTSAGLWGKSDGVWYRVSEYYFDSKKEGFQRTDEEHYREIINLSKKAQMYNCYVDTIVCDPSAASFIECIRRHGEITVLPAKNDVISGIRKVSDAINQQKIKIHISCRDTLREFSLYAWDEKARSDAPIKQYDHSMDDIRYFVTQFLKENNEDFCVLSVLR